MRTKTVERSKTEILIARSDFISAQICGARWTSKTVILQIKPNGLDHIRTGITVTKKTQKSSVRRNRIKRRLRAAIADCIAQKAAPGYDYILIGRKESETCDYDRLLNDLEWCLKRTGHIRENPA